MHRTPCCAASSPQVYNRTPLHKLTAALANGPAKKLVGLAVEGRMPVREGAPIFAGDAEVGKVTSGGFAPTVGAPIAMGYVAAAHTAP